jgi:hypothetical protein
MAYASFSFLVVGVALVALVVQVDLLDQSLPSRRLHHFVLNPKA